MLVASVRNFVLKARIVRLAVTLAVAPMLVLGPLSVETMLIHYDGHDIHTHAVASNDVGKWREATAHEHAAHDHDCQAHDPHDHGDDFFIVVDLPVAVVKGRSSGMASLVLAGAATTPWSAVTPMATVENGSLHSSFLGHAPDFPPTRSVSRILQTNHALLL